MFAASRISYAKVQQDNKTETPYETDIGQNKPVKTQKQIKRTNNKEKKNSMLQEERKKKTLSITLSVWSATKD